MRLEVDGKILFHNTGILGNLCVSLKCFHLWLHVDQGHVKLQVVCMKMCSYSAMLGPQILLLPS